MDWTFYVLPQKMTFELDVKKRQSEELFEDDKDWLSLDAAWSMELVSRAPQFKELTVSLICPR